MKIGIDFDGTCVTHEYPKIGKDIGAVLVLKKLTAAGHKLILNTMRCGKELQDAVNWFSNNDIPLYGVNEDPGQKEWTQSPKVFANIYIDDAALGCPLIWTKDKNDRPFVDWEKVDELFANNDIYHSPDPVLRRHNMKVDDFSLDHYRDALSSESIYETTGTLLVKHDDCILIYFDDPVDKKCRYLRFPRDKALEMSKKIIATLEKSTVKEEQDVNRNMGPDLSCRT